MSHQESPSKKFHQYPQKAILAKMPSDYIGIAKQLSKIKKIRMMSQKQFDSFHHEVSSIQKINQNLAKSLNKKKKQLKYLQAVRNRYIHQSIQKDKLNEMKQIQLERLRTKTIEQKQKFQTRLTDARQKLMFRKKTQCQETKKQLNHYKSQKMIEDSRMYQKNQSRVQQIQQQKVRIKDYYNRFFQNKNKKVMYNYKQLINRQKKTQMNYKTEMKNLQKKLVLLKNDAQNKQRILDDLNSSIDSLRQSRVSMRSSSRIRSTSTMTPLQIISGTAGGSYTSTNNPQKLLQKPKIKLSQRY